MPLLSNTWTELRAIPFNVKFSHDVNGNSTVHPSSRWGRTRMPLDDRHEYGGFEAAQAAVEDYLNKKLPGDIWELVSFGFYDTGTTVDVVVLCRYVRPL